VNRLLDGMSEEVLFGQFLGPDELTNRDPVGVAALPMTPVLPSGGAGVAASLPSLRR
jgi:hypothetical protein